MYQKADLRIQNITTNHVFLIKNKRIEKIMRVCAEYKTI